MSALTLPQAADKVIELIGDESRWSQTSSNSVGKLTLYSALQTAYGYSPCSSPLYKAICNADTKGRGIDSINRGSTHAELMALIRKAGGLPEPAAAK